MNNPFDLVNYKPQVRFDDLERSRRSSYQATQTVNKTRKQGIEPSRPYSEQDARDDGGRDADAAGA